MAPSKARRRQLQKLAERRAAERRRQRRNRVIAIVVAFLVAAGGGMLAFFAFTGGEGDEPAAGPSATPSPTPEQIACGGERPAAAGVQKPQFQNPPPMRIQRNKRYTAVMKTSCGTIELELFARQTPVTVNSFVFLANREYFDGTTFHRVIANFMNQGGDPTGTGTGGPGYQFRDEIRDSLKFDEPGLLAMANPGQPNTNGSQFFITTSEPAHLNGKHTIFGRVTKGYDVAQTINQLPTDERDKPLETVYVESVRIIVR